jgi:hypothetical protein
MKADSSTSGQAVATRIEHHMPDDYVVSAETGSTSMRCERVHEPVSKSKEFLYFDASDLLLLLLPLLRFKPLKIR